MAPLGKSALLVLLSGIGLMVGAGCKAKEKTETENVASSGGEKTSGGEKKMLPIQRQDWGKTKDGTPVELYTLTNKNGSVAKIATYGATLTELHVRDKDGKLGDVVLGYDNLEPYETRSNFFGATTGRVANRIAGGKFTLNGVEYKLVTNNGPNHLHGGTKGIDKFVWKAEPMPSDDGPAVKFTHRNPDMHEGYPGNLDITVIYTLTNKDELKIDYKARTDKATPVNLTHHSYFNLGTPASGDVLDHVLLINADRYTPVDATLIPTGELAPVKGTSLDFTTPMTIGSRRSQTPLSGGGYDHNYVLNGELGKMKLAARVSDPQTGRTMEIHTTEPGVQLYTGNHLKDNPAKAGVTYQKHAGFCLETQHYPDSVNKPNFPTVILQPGETYSQVTIHKFSAKK